MHAFIKAWILPPGCLIILLLLALISYHKHRLIMRAIVLFVTICLYLLSLPSIATQLAAPLQNHTRLNAKLATTAQAIVVLGGGRRGPQPQWHNHEAASYVSTTRTTYGAWLARRYRLPLLLSGGRSRNNQASEAQLMNQNLTRQQQPPARWLENRSRNTHQNAVFSAQILKQHHIKRILLVTSATHLSRARYFFQQQGMIVIPAACDFITTPILSSKLDYWLPHMSALVNSYHAIYAYLGLIQTLKKH